MADEEDKKPEGEEAATVEGAEGEAPKKKWTPKRLALFIGLPLILIIGGSVGAYFGGVFGGDEPVPAEGEAAVELGADGKPLDPNRAPTYYNIPDMIVNLQAERSRPIYLKISLSLELSKDSDIPPIEKVLPRVIDNFQVYLRELRVDELRGSAGMYRLREELLMRVNQAVAPVKIKDVLFREMLVQ
ncbi:MAG: flagellar basal body-associated FliL family protein [Bdellovibrionales bacterium]